MRRMWATLNDTINNGNDAVLVTVTASSGSVPRGAGAHMVVTDEGRIAGTIGGGAVEQEAVLRAQDVLANRLSMNQSYALHNGDIASLGMICGGSVRVHFLFIPAGEAAVIRLLEDIDARYGMNTATWLILDITDGEAGSITISDGPDSDLIESETDSAVLAELHKRCGNMPEIVDVAGRSYYVEKIIAGDKVYIFGGGHVSQQLTRVLTYVNFTCVVIENRQEFADPELFAKGVEIVLTDDYSSCDIFNRITSEDYICIMTRGHMDDYEVQKQALKTSACYIGVIGSRKKISLTNERLLEDGYTYQDIDRMTRPIGLPIKAETPEEIAISIAGQLIELRAIKNGSKK